MTLRIANEQTQVSEVIDRLNTLSIAFKKEIDVNLLKPVFVDGDDLYHGVPAINKFIDQLEQESHKWWYCNC